MEPIFSNSCVFSKGILEELNKKMMSLGFKIYCIFFMIIFIALSTISFIMEQNVIGVIFAICFILIFVTLLIKPKMVAKRVFLNYNKLYGCEVETRTFFYDEIIIGKNLQTNQSVKASYSDITSIEESKHLYIIKLYKNIALTLSKDGFISDNSSDFIKFIIKKCPQAKIKL